METLTVQNTNQTPKRPRGFAILTQEQRREIARKGGKAAQALGKAHRFTQEEARVAGQKGGQARRVRPLELPQDEKAS